MKTELSAIVAISILCGCAGKQTLVRPEATPIDASSKVIDKPRDVVWNNAVPALGKQYFVINNLDKSSGLINLSYSGDPEKYVDCGQVQIFNPQETKTHQFPGAKASTRFDVYVYPAYLHVERQMSLEGRVNLIFEEMSPTQTRVSANTRYVLERRSTISQGGSGAGTGGRAAFPAGQGQDQLECVALGTFERDLLLSVQ